MALRVGVMERDVYIDNTAMKRLAVKFRMYGCPTIVYTRDVNNHVNGARMTYGGHPTKQVVDWSSLQRRAIKAPSSTQHPYKRPAVLPRAKL